jgi:hypothetical protein
MSCKICIADLISEIPPSIIFPTPTIASLSSFPLWLLSNQTSDQLFKKKLEATRAPHFLVQKEEYKSRGLTMALVTSIYRLPSLIKDTKSDVICDSAYCRATAERSGDPDV